LCRYRFFLCCKSVLITGSSNYRGTACNLRIKETYSQYSAELSSVHQAGRVCWNRCLVWEHRPDKRSVTVGLASSCWERSHCCTNSQLRTEIYKCVSKYCIVASCYVVFISACPRFRVDALCVRYFLKHVSAFRTLSIIVLVHSLSA
jgi:hypothetical protein